MQSRRARLRIWERGTVQIIEAALKSLGVGRHIQVSIWLSVYEYTS